MIRAWLAAAAIGGFLSVTAGAAAAHFSAADERTADLLRTGALYGMVHAAELIAVAAVAEARPRSDLTLIMAGWSFTAGIALFSFSLFGSALTGMRWLGLITPFGGVGLLIGWVAVGMHVFRRQS